MTSKMEELRAAGNALVSAKQYAEAIAKYSEGLDAAAADASLDAAAVEAQRVLLWSNRAMCHLQLNQFDSAAADCSKALEKDPKNEKARYRRAQAFVGLGSFAPAFSDIRLVLQLNPSNKAAIALARKIKDSVQEDVHGLQKALDAIASGVESGSQALVAQQPKTEEAIKFLEMKCFSDLAGLPKELESKGGLRVLWRVVERLLALHSDKDADAVMQRAVLSLLSHVVALLAVVASASLELAALVYAHSGPATLHLVLELLHAQVALEYSSSSDASLAMPLAGRKAIVKLCAFVFKHLMLSTDDDAELRRVLSALLDGLRSQELELQISALDGVLHFLSVAAVAPVSAGPLDADALRAKTTHFATLAHELGVFSLFHAKAASALAVLTPEAQGAKSVLLSRLPLVFTQCLARFEGQDALLKTLVREHCVAPVLAATATDRAQLDRASASCLLLSALFLSNAKLALWAVQQTGNDGTLFLLRLHDFLVASRTFTDPRARTRELQEIWVDCVASVCGVEHGTGCVPPALRVEIVKMLASAMDKDDLVLKASALSIQVKLGIVEKTLEVESVDGQQLLDTVFDVLERAHAFESASKDRQQLYWSGASPKERGIEALSYLITLTPVKNAFAKRARAVTSVFQVDFPVAKALASDHHSHVGFRSNVYYGIGYILHHVLTSEAALKKKQMDNMDMSAEQYEELQKALKQKSALDDGDSTESVHARVRHVLASKDVLATLVQLLKYATTKSQNVVEMAALSALHAADVPEFRGSLVQSGVFQALLPLSLHSAAVAAADKSKSKSALGKQQAHGSAISNAAGQAIAKILISTNPNLVPSAALFSSIRPLLDLCKGETQLLQFEALMALTNIASVSDATKQRIVSEPQGLATLQYLQFSEHELVRRAATEAICNLLPNEEVVDKVFLNDEKLRLWLAFASVEEEEEDFETARAAGGALAMVSQVPQVSWLLMKHGGLQTFTRVIEVSKHDESLHRAFFAMENMLAALSSSADDAEKAADTQEFLAEVKRHRAALVKRLKELVPAANVPSTPVHDAAQSLLSSLLKAVA